MQILLLERIGPLGQMGDVVNVKNGYARNYLLPQKKALRATQENIAYFETQRVQLVADNLIRSPRNWPDSPSSRSGRPATPDSSMALCPPATSPKPSPRGASPLPAIKSF